MRAKNRFKLGALGAVVLALLAGLGLGATQPKDATAQQQVFSDTINFTGSATFVPAIAAGAAGANGAIGAFALQSCRVVSDFDKSSKNKTSSFGCSVAIAGGAYAGVDSGLTAGTVTGTFNVDATARPSVPGEGAEGSFAIPFEIAFGVGAGGARADTIGVPAGQQATETSRQDGVVNVSVTGTVSNVTPVLGPGGDTVGFTFGVSLTLTESSAAR